MSLCFCFCRAHGLEPAETRGRPGEGGKAICYIPLDAALGRVLLGVLLSGEAGHARRAADGDEAEFRIGERQGFDVLVELEGALAAPPAVGCAFLAVFAVRSQGADGIVKVEVSWSGCVSACSRDEMRELAGEGGESARCSRLTQSRSPVSGSRDRSDRMRSERALRWSGESGLGFVSCCWIQAFSSVKSMGSSSRDPAALPLPFVLLTVMVLAPTVLNLLFLN